MFLPALLMRDYGWPAWFIFAAPNVLGAAAMGWTLRSREHSLAMIEAHKPAMVAFSLVTRAFQWYFAFGLLARAFSGTAFAAPLIALGLAIAVSNLSLKRGPRPSYERPAPTAPWTGVIFWLLSASLLTIAILSPELPPPRTVGNLPLSAPNATGLLAVCLFGFIFCPYFDLTFHRARIEAPHPRFAFGFGFGVLFHAMIIGTALYSGSAWAIDSLPAVLIAVHIAMQIGFTVEAHSSELPASPGSLTSPTSPTASNAPPSPLLRQLPLLSLLAGFVAFLAVRSASAHFGGTNFAFEWGYRIFMGAYGLVFPAYALIAMVPTWSAPRKPARPAILAWLAAITLAAPASYLAFIDKAMWWIGPGAIVIIAATLIAWRTGRPQAASS